MTLALQNTTKPTLPAVEKIRAGKRFSHICGLMGLYAGSAMIGKVGIRDHDRRLKFFTRNIGVYTRRALKLFNVEVKIHGYNPELMREKRFLLVSNHLSYIDIFLLSSIQPCVFVTSVDLGEQFFLGDMAELGGSIFVERRHRGRIGRDIGVIAKTLRDHHVVIYPEGTSSDGERVLPFKRSLLSSATEAGADIMPVVIKYTEVDGEPFNLNNRDRLCWYGDMSFFPHFMGLMKLKNAKAELHFLEPIPVEKDSCRHELSERAYRAITSVYGAPLADSTSGEAVKALLT